MDEAHCRSQKKVISYDSVPGAEGVVGVAVVQPHRVDIEEAVVDGLFLQDTYSGWLFLVHPTQFLDGVDAPVPFRADLVQDLPAEGAVRERGEGALVLDQLEVLASGSIAKSNVGILFPDQGEWKNPNSKRPFFWKLFGD